MSNEGSPRWYTLAFALQVAANSAFGFLFARGLAHRFGATAEKDAFDIGYAIPFLILKLCGFALIHGVATARFSRLRAQSSPAQASEVFSSTLTSMLLASVVLSVAALVWSTPLVQLLAPGLPAASQVQVERLMVIMVPLTFALGIGTFLSAILIAYGVPLCSEVPQIASRCGGIAWLLVRGETTDLHAIAASLAVGAMLAVGCQAAMVVRLTPIRYRFGVHPGNVEFRGLMKQVPGLVASALLAQVAFVSMQRLASCDGPGSVALINYSLGIISPISLLLGKPLCLAFGPRYSSLVARGQSAEALRHMLQLVTLVLAVTIPISILVATHAELVMGSLYGGGEFDARTVSRAGEICRIAAWAIPAAVVYWITLIPLLSIRRSEVSGLLLSCGHVVQIVLSQWLFPRFHVNGLVWAYVIAISFQACVAVAISFFMHAKTILPGATDPRMSPAR
jgi:putative peptidoglycan lipid II flippase